MKSITGMQRSSLLRSRPPAALPIEAEIRSLARRLESPADLDPLIERIGESRFVLLGEASHGTAEFYDWRTEISKRLIEEKGFSFIAVEGDWPDCYSVNRFVKGHHGESAEDVVRQQHARDGVMLVGFGTDRGRVMASCEWGAPMERMHVPAAREGSYEHAIRESGVGDSLLLFDGDRTPALEEQRGHRAIGVVYDPRAEQWGNYVPTILPLRYDAFLFIEQTKAVDALHMRVERDGDFPETSPTGE